MYVKHSLVFCVIIVVYGHKSWFGPLHYHHLNRDILVAVQKCQNKC